MAHNLQVMDFFARMGCAYVQCSKSTITNTEWTWKESNKFLWNRLRSNQFYSFFGMNKNVKRSQNTKLLVSIWCTSVLVCSHDVIIYLRLRYLLEKIRFCFEPYLRKTIQFLSCCTHYLSFVIKFINIFKMSLLVDVLKNVTSNRCLSLLITL